MLSQKLARALIKRAIPVAHIFEAFALDGVTEEDLQKFETNPIEWGPKLENTKLDKAGTSTKELLASPWNTALIDLLVKEADAISSRPSQTNRFGEQRVDWADLFTARFQSIFRTEIKLRRKPGESHTAHAARVAAILRKSKWANAKTGILHWVCLFDRMYPPSN